jgi:hypothetical protein
MSTEVTMAYKDQRNKPVIPRIVYDGHIGSPGLFRFAHKGLYDSCITQ